MSELISALAARLESSGERVMLTLTGYLAVLLLLVAAFVALVYAGATAVSAVYGPVAAALTIAVAALSAALLLVAWLSHRRRLVARQNRMRRSVLQPTALNAASHLLPVMLKASPIATLVAVAAAAYVVSKASQRQD